MPGRGSYWEGGDGLGATRIAKAVCKSEPTVRRWLARFAAAGVDGLLRDASRPPGRKPPPKSTLSGGACR